MKQLLSDSLEFVYSRITVGPILSELQTESYTGGNNIMSIVRLEQIACDDGICIFQIQFKLKACYILAPCVVWLWWVELSRTYLERRTSYIMQYKGAPSVRTVIPSGRSLDYEISPTFKLTLTKKHVCYSRQKLAGYFLTAALIQ